jgi:hypothetical protein
MSFKPGVDPFNLEPDRASSSDPCVVNLATLAPVQKIWLEYSQSGIRDRSARSREKLETELLLNGVEDIDASNPRRPATLLDSC